MSKIKIGQNDYEKTTLPHDVSHIYGGYDHKKSSNENLEDLDDLNDVDFENE